MITEMEILAKVNGVTTAQLHLWISEEWVRPARDNADIAFSEADIARVRLLAMLCNELGVGNEAVPIILSLIDQVHDMHEQMRIIADAIEAQPDDVRTCILECARRVRKY